MRPEAFFRGVPDLAVEVISPSERKTKIRLKMEKYFALGTRIVWLVYPRRKTVEVYTAPGVMVTIAAGELDGGDVLPGFRLAAGRDFCRVVLMRINADLNRVSRAFFFLPSSWSGASPRAQQRS